MGKENFDDREAKIIRERRDELYMTQLQVAVEAGLGLQEYQRYEYGKFYVNCNEPVCTGSFLWLQVTPRPALCL